MVKININLISGEASLGYLFSYIQKKLKFIASVSLMLLILTITLSFSFFFYYNRQLSSLSLNLAQVGGKIKSYQETESSLLLLKSHSNFLAEVIKRRVGLIKVLTDLQKMAPANISLENIESDSQGKLKLNVTAESLFSLNTFISLISREDFVGDFELLNISSIVKTDKNNYNFILELTKTKKL